MTAAPGRRSSSRLTYGLVFALSLLFALFLFAQWVGWGAIGVLQAQGATPAEARATAVYVLIVNVASATAFGLALWAGRVANRRWRVRVVAAVTAAAAISALRISALDSVGDTVSRLDDLADFLTWFGSGVTASVIAFVVSDQTERAQAEIRERARVAAAASARIAHVESAEAVRRRLVSDRLHGTIQNRLALATAGLDQIAADALAVDERLAGRVETIAESLDELRENDVRALSHEIFPAAATVSVVRAVRSILDRLPSSSYGTLVIGDSYRRMMEPSGADAVPLPDRLVVVDIIEEALTNAVKHGNARRVTVHIDVHPTDPLRFEGSVVDDGSGLPEPPGPLSGLERHAERLRARGGDLRLAPGDDGGAVLSFWLPLRPDLR